MSGVAHDAGGLGGWSGEADGGGRATILTPELTPLQLVPAGPGSRFLALIIDTALILGVSAVLETLLLATTPLGLAAALGATFGFALSWAYPIWFEVTRQGQTPGKKLLGLRVVDARGLGVGLSQSFVRNIVRTLDFVPLFYGLGLAVALGDRQGRRLGDLAADTLVIEDGQAADPVRALAAGRQLRSLESPELRRRVARRISLEERELLIALTVRLPRLDAQARFDLLEEVGGYYRVRLGIDDPHLSGEQVVRGLTALLVGLPRQPAEDPP